MRNSAELCALPVCASGGIGLRDMQEALQRGDSSVVNQKCSLYRARASAQTSAHFCHCPVQKAG